MCDHEVRWMDMGHLRRASWREYVRLRLCFGALVAATCIAAACGGSPSQTASPAAVSPDTWAVVDGQQITRADVDEAYRRTQDPSQAASEEETLTAKLN